MNSEEKAKDKATLRRRPRHQTGHLYRSGEYIYVRFWRRDAQNTPKHVSERLCPGRDLKLTSKKVLDLRDAFMRKINGSSGAAARVLITDYWDDVYLPYLREQMRQSTVDGCVSKWHKHLEPHFKGRYLQDYQRHHGNEFLLALSGSGCSRGTAFNIKQLASGLFDHALKYKGLIEANPWRNTVVDVLKGMDRPKERPIYTLEEAQNVVAALDSNLEWQTIMALACYAGIRRAEIAGLKWEDLLPKDGYIHVSRQWGRYKEMPLKTESSHRDVPIMAPLAVVLDKWWEASRQPRSGWLFPSRVGTPKVMRYIGEHIEAVLTAKGLEWKKFHAGRHGLGMMLTAATGNALAAQKALGHKNLSTTQGFYLLHRDNDAASEGMRLLEARVSAK